TNPGPPDQFELLACFDDIGSNLGRTPYRQSIVVADNALQFRWLQPHFDVNSQSLTSTQDFHSFSRQVISDQNPHEPVLLASSGERAVIVRQYPSVKRPSGRRRGVLQQ